MLFEVDLLGGLSDVTDLEAGPQTLSRERAVHVEEDNAFICETRLLVDGTTAELTKPDSKMAPTL